MENKEIEIKINEVREKSCDIGYNSFLLYVVVNTERSNKR